jgi:hypothetical protein
MMLRRNRLHLCRKGYWRSTLRLTSIHAEHFAHQEKEELET